MNMRELSLEQLQAAAAQHDEARLAAKERARRVRAEIAERGRRRTVLAKLRNNVRLKPEEKAWVAALPEKERAALVREATETMTAGIQRAVAAAADVGGEAAG